MRVDDRVPVWHWLWMSQKRPITWSSSMELRTLLIKTCPNERVTS